MSEKKYFIDRDAHGDVTLWREDEPGDIDPFAVTIDSEVIDLMRSFGVEDRTTQPDWSHVPTGTAGTATVRGLRGVRVMRRDDGRWSTWIPVSCVSTEPYVAEDADVTAFVPDVVVTDDLIERVADELGGLHSLGLENVADRVEAILRGES